MQEFKKSKPNMPLQALSNMKTEAVLPGLNCKHEHVIVHYLEYCQKLMNEKLQFMPS
jgi:hypothetical protein